MKPTPYSRPKMMTVAFREFVLFFDLCFGLVRMVTLVLAMFDSCTRFLSIKEATMTHAARKAGKQRTEVSEGMQGRKPRNGTLANWAPNGGVLESGWVHKGP